MKSDRRVVLGLSGGVDSAVAARLLQRDGYEVLGLYLDAGDPSARADAEATAAFLGVDLRVCDIREALEAQVCQPFAKAYLRGETPNPCILCNPKVKFRALCDDADARGAAFIATGHYARAKDGMLFRGEPRQRPELHALPPDARTGAPAAAAAGRNGKGARARARRRVRPSRRAQAGQHGDLLHSRPRLRRLARSPRRGARTGTSAVSRRNRRAARGRSPLDRRTAAAGPL